MNKPKSKLGNPLFIVAIVLIGLAAVQLATKPKTEGALVPAADRKPPGELTWPLAENGGGGSTWKLSDQKGKVTLVNIFATWCPPCVREMPDIVKVTTELAPQGLTALAVSLDQDTKLVDPFVKRHNITFPVSLGAADPKATLFETIPVTLLYDRQGRTARIYNGMLDEATLRKDLQALLAEAP